MRIWILSMLLFQIACKKETIVYSHKIIANNTVNIELIKTMQIPEKAMLQGYLFVYGNACTPSSKKIKCKALEVLKIKDECEKKQMDFIKKWFKNDVIKALKMQKCPNLANKASIQNKIKELTITRNADTIKTTIHVIGMNTSQEKNWDITQTEAYLIKNNTFIKLD